MVVERPIFLQRHGTHWDVLRVLKRIGKTTLDNITIELRHLKQSDLGAAAVRAHLVALQHEGLVAVDEVRAKVGRPYHMYSLTLEGEALFPKNYHVLATLLLEHLVTGLTHDEHKKIFAYIADRLAATYDLHFQPDQNLTERVEALVAAIDGENNLTDYMPVNDGTPDKPAFLIRRYNCPYRRIAEQHPLVCDLDTQIFQRLLAAQVQRTACQAEGFSACTFHVSPLHDYPNMAEHNVDESSEMP